MSAPIWKMNPKTFAAFVALLVGVGCGAPPDDGTGANAPENHVYTDEETDAETEAGADVDVQGHRGARGLLPENTIRSFEKALELGVHTIEMDVVVTADSVVVVSHEPWFSSVICSTSDGEPVSEADERSYNIYRMTYEETTTFDCGSRGNRLFPTQQPEPARKPRLDSTLIMLERFAEAAGRPAPEYNIEIKSRPEFDGTFAPEPHTFARLVHDVIQSAALEHRATVQSFDTRPLQILHQIDSLLSLSLLVDNELGFAANFERLGFKPSIYSPQYQLVTRALVDSAHALGVKVIPWTVNESASLRELLDLGVDGLITDYPDSAFSVLREEQATSGTNRRTE